MFDEMTRMGEFDEDSFGGTIEHGGDVPENL
jgi:hypothetical protein